MSDTGSSEAYERLLHTAEELFLSRGYAAVSMRDIAEALNVRQATLYYHVPHGKSQLFLAVVERSMARHKTGIEHAIQAVEPALRPQLHAIVYWLVSQPPVDLLRLLRIDRVALSEEDGQHMLSSAYRLLMAPIAQVFADAQARGEIRALSPMMLAGTLLAMLDWLSFPIDAQYTTLSRQSMAIDVVDMLLDGLWVES